MRHRAAPGTRRRATSSTLWPDDEHAEQELLTLLSPTDESPRRPRAQTKQRTGRDRLITTWSAARSVFLTLFAGLGVVCILVFAGSLVFGVKPLVVISGSMEPTVPVGSVAFTRAQPADEVAVGDIVTVERPRNLGLITHRVVSVEPGDDGTTQLVLRGDANTVDDPEPYTVTSAGRYLGHVPGLGSLALVLQTRGGLVLAGGVALFLLAVFLFDPRRTDSPEPEDES